MHNLHVYTNSPCILFVHTQTLCERSPSIHKFTMHTQTLLLLYYQHLFACPNCLVLWHQRWLHRRRLCCHFTASVCFTHKLSVALQHHHQKPLSRSAPLSANLCTRRSLLRKPRASRLSDLTRRGKSLLPSSSSFRSLTTATVPIFTCSWKGIPSCLPLRSASPCLEQRPLRSLACRPRSAPPHSLPWCPGKPWTPAERSPGSPRYEQDTPTNATHQWFFFRVEKSCEHVAAWTCISALCKSLSSSAAATQWKPFYHEGAAGHSITLSVRSWFANVLDSTPQRRPG